MKNCKFYFFGKIVTCLVTIFKMEKALARLLISLKFVYIYKVLAALFKTFGMRKDNMVLPAICNSLLSLVLTSKLYMGIILEYIIYR